MRTTLSRRVGEKLRVVARGKRLGIERNAQLQIMFLMTVISEDNTQPATADGGIAQQRVGVRHSRPAYFVEPLRLNVVEVDERQPRHGGDITRVIQKFRCRKLRFPIFIIF